MVSTGRHSMNRASTTRVRRVAFVARRGIRFALEVLRQLFPEEEVLGGQARVGPQAKHNKLQDGGDEIEDGADHHGWAMIARQSTLSSRRRDSPTGWNICGRQASSRKNPSISIRRLGWSYSSHSASSRSPSTGRNFLKIFFCFQMDRLSSGRSLTLTLWGSLNVGAGYLPALHVG